MHEVTVDLLDPAIDAAWDALVVDSPQGTAFHRSEWLRMLADTDPLDLRIHRFLLRDAKGRVRAGWALPVGSFFGLRICHSFEFFYAGPLLCRDLEGGSVHGASERWAALSVLAATVGRTLDIVVAECHPSLQDLRPLMRSGFQIVPEYTHRWPVRGLEQVWATMNREKRRQIRRAQEQYRYLRDDDLASLDQFFGLYRRTVAKFGQAPTRLWEGVLKRRLAWLRERDGCRLYACQDADGAALASVLVLLSPEDGTAYLWRAGSVPDGRSVEPLPALYWHVAESLADEDREWDYINFGGSPAASLSRFKDYLGATPVLHFRLIRRRHDLRVGLWQGQERLRQALRWSRLRLALGVERAGRGRSSMAVG